MAVYILAITPPLHHARYYVGLCADDRLGERLHEHKLGGSHAACITRAAIKSGRTLQCVAILRGGTHLDEKAIKARKSTPKFVEQLRRNQPEGWHILPAWALSGIVGQADNLKGIRK
jgi:hypothetical protein